MGYNTSFSLEMVDGDSSIIGQLWEKNENMVIACLEATRSSPYETFQGYIEPFIFHQNLNYSLKAISVACGARAARIVSDDGTTLELILGQAVQAARGKLRKVPLHLRRQPGEFERDQIGAS